MSLPATPASSKPASKTDRARRKPSRSSAARANWLYTQKEVEGLYHVCSNTIRNWRRYGLKPIVPGTLLFLGRDLNAFHKQRKADAKRPCAPYEVYCVCCKQRHSLKLESFEVGERGRFHTRIHLRCPETGGQLSTYINDTVLDELRHLTKRNLSPETPV